MSDSKKNSDGKSDKKKPFFSVTDDEATASYGASVERPGVEIGPYKLLSVLGEGGFGIVYLAEQRKPIKRRVALKIVKPGMDSKEILARFEAERQTLALLDHPNIAKIHDAGMTKTRRPYFVMEYVKGTPITEYCDRHKLTIETRLKLFQEVCNAIQYAHQKGIIHRDIKPSNVLISTEEEQCLPKVIDFGVAKAQTQSMTDRTLYTEVGQVIGTPEYMSPEQVEMNAEGIDTRSDVYSLGVVFYELLVGVLPFDTETLRGKGIDAMRRVILDEEPRTPSTRLTSLGEDAKKIAQQRQSDLGSLARCLRKELEWIPLKAMRKDPERRYRSASEFADDIQNYLNGNPLIAGPEAVSYKLSKFVRRHKTSVVSTVIIAVLLVVGFAVSSGLYVKAEQAGRTTVERAEAYRQALYRSAVARVYAEYQIGYAGNTKSLLESCPADLRGWEWHYLRYISDEARLTIDGHDLTVTAVAFNPSGRQIASASMDKSIKIWNAETGAEMMTLLGHSFWVRCLSFSHDGKRIVSVSTDQTIKIWNTVTGKELKSMSLSGLSRPEEIVSLAVGPNGKCIVLGGCFGAIKVWDTMSGVEVMSWDGHKDGVLGISFSPDGKRIVSGSGDRTIKIWDAADGSVVRTIQGHSGKVSSTLFSPDGKYIISGDWDGNIKKWDAISGAGLSSFRAHKGEITSMSLAQDGKRLASASVDCNIKIWDISTGDELATLRGHSQVVKSVAFSGDGEQLVSGSQDKTIKMWDTASSRECKILAGHEGPIGGISFSPDSELLTSCANDKTVRIWNRKTGRELIKLEGHEDYVTCVAFSPDGRRIASSSWDKTIKIWDSVAGVELTTLSGHTNRIYSLAFTPDGEHIVSGSKDETVKIWDAENGEEFMTLHGHQAGVSYVAISPDGQFIASSSFDGAIKIWGTETGSEIATLDGFEGEVARMTFSPDGQHLASVGGTKELGVPQGPLAKIWDIAKRQEIMTLHGHSSGVGGVDFSPDGKRIVTNSMDDSIRIWDAATGHEILALQTVGFSDPWIAQSVAYSPDGRALAVASNDKILLFESAAPEGD